MFEEYLGIPGGGKTYSATKYKKQLRRDGKSFKDISRQKGMSLWLRIFYRVADKIIYVLPKYRKQIKQYRIICKGCGQTPKYLPFSLEYCIKDIVLFSFLHDCFADSKDIILNDEGQLQRFVFLSVQYDVSLDDLLVLWSESAGNVKTKYVRNSPEVAFKNIKRRNRHVCPMDELDDEQLAEYLEAYYLGCERVVWSGMVKGLEIIDSFL